MNCRPFVVVTLAFVSLVPAGQVVGYGSTSMPATATATILSAIKKDALKPFKAEWLITKYIGSDGHGVSSPNIATYRIMIADLP